MTGNPAAHAGGLQPQHFRSTAAPAGMVAAFWRDLTLQEVSGSLGDLGTFLPLLVGLVKTSGLNLSTTLIFSGLYNIITGIAFGIPMPVQPMKTIAAVALSQAGLTVPQIMAAGIFVSACVTFMGATKTFWLASKLIPMPVIRGLQLGLGMLLAKKGWQHAWYADGHAPPSRQWWGVEGLLLAILACGFILVAAYPAEGEDTSGDGGSPRPQQLLPMQARGTPARQQLPPSATDGGGDSEEGDSLHEEDSHLLLPLKQTLELIGNRAERSLTGEIGAPAAGSDGGTCGSASAGLLGSAGNGGKAGVQLPAALILVSVGVVLTLLCYPEVVSALRFGPSAIQALVPSAEDWKIGILQAGLPQLALTSFNSVISVCQLAGELFPHRPASPDRVALSVGVMNLVGCWFGAMPCCHGAGGLAAQARFGARSGAAPIFLGLVKLGLGLLFGSSLLLLLKSFPSPLLGAMLVFSGIQLAACGHNQRGERGTAVLLLTAAVTLAMSNTALGVTAGLAASYLLVAWDLLSEQGPWLCRRAAAACSLQHSSSGGARVR